MAGASIGIKNLDSLQKKLEDKKKASEKVMKALASDARKRVPGWVAAEVTKTYGIKKSDINEGKLGDVKVQGSDIKNMKVIYSGRLLTHTHFSMSPTLPKAGGYTLKASVVKGQRKTLGKVKKLTKKQRAALTKNLTGSGTQTSDKSPIMLMRGKGDNYLPFQRKSKDRKDIEVIKTISLPQMVSSERTQADIQAALSEGLQKRLDHHMKRYGLMD